ncbi:MAG: LiaI-LiaF-like domain-containing protein, partial [Candidatus Acidiferrum sp.]
MARLRPRGSSLFSGLVLVFVGLLLLLHNYHGYDIRYALGHWWPLILIVWGAVKLYERTVGIRSGDTSGTGISAGEVFLVLGLLALVSGVIGWDSMKGWSGTGGDWNWGDSYPYDLDVAPKAVPANARITIHNPHGDISVRASDTPEIRVSGKTNVKTWSESDADRLAKPVSVEIVQNGDGYEVRPSGISAGDSRIGVDMEIDVPAKSALTIRSDRGDVTVSDMTTPVTVNSIHGDVEVRNNTGDVNIDMRKGDTKVSDVKGNVKISGKGDEIEVVTASGSLTIDGEFFGPIRADKIAKGVR